MQVRQNDAMLPAGTARGLSPTLRRRLGLGCAALLISGPALVGCSGDDATPSVAGSGSPSPSGSSQASWPPSATAIPPYLPVPDGVELTAQGSQLAVGDHAVVAYRPRQEQVAALDIQVLSLQQTTFKLSFSGWKLDASSKKATPYFVRARVANVGKTDLGGRPVPLYIVDGNNTLVESSRFASTFKPCSSDPLPKKFRTGAETKVCLVYLAPEKGDLTAVSFRPSQEFNPITWTGDVTKLKDKAKNKKKSKNKA